MVSSTDAVTPEGLDTNSKFETRGLLERCLFGSIVIHKGKAVKVVNTRDRLVRGQDKEGNESDFNPNRDTFLGEYPLGYISLDDELAYLTQSSTRDRKEGVFPRSLDVAYVTGNGGKSRRHPSDKELMTHLEETPSVSILEAIRLIEDTDAPFVILSKQVALVAGENNMAVHARGLLVGFLQRDNQTVFNIFTKKKMNLQEMLDAA